MVLQRDLPVETLLLTLPEVGRVHAISRSKLYDFLNSGNLPSFYIGKSRRVRISDVQAFVNGGGQSQAVSLLRPFRKSKVDWPRNSLSITYWPRSRPGAAGRPLLPLRLI